MIHVTNMTVTIISLYLVYHTFALVSKLLSMQRHGTYPHSTQRVVFLLILSIWHPHVMGKVLYREYTLSDFQHFVEDGVNCSMTHCRNTMS